MADSGGSNRDASRPRQKVQQLRPTNKELPSAAPAVAAPTPAPLTAPSQSGNEENNGRTSASSAAAPVPTRVMPRIVTGQGSGSTILVNNCQRGNPILQHIRNVGWEYGDIVPDYQVGVAGCALFLSLRYHRLHPEYIHSRIQKMGHMYTLRILLVMCDVDQHESAIKELTKVCVVNNLTLMVAWTPEEAGTYLERYKAFEHKAPDLIRERVNDDYMSHLHSALTNIKGVNKTDVITLATTFGSFKQITEATSDDLSQCPGFGPTKVKRIRDVFSQPFKVGETRTGRERRAQREKLQAVNGVNAEKTVQPSSSLSQSSSARGRFIDDEEDQEALREMEAQLQENGTAGEGRTIPASPAAYIARLVSGGQAVTNVTDSPVVEEDVEDADDWDVMDHMTEEEKLQLAMEMSMMADADLAEE